MIQAPPRAIWTGTRFPYNDALPISRQGVLLSRPLVRSGGGVEAAGDPDCRSDARFGRHPRQLLGLRPPRADPVLAQGHDRLRSEEHTSELQSLMRISNAVFCLKKKQYTK